MKALAPHGLGENDVLSTWSAVRRGELRLDEGVPKSAAIRWAENFIRDGEGPDTIADRYEVPEAQVRRVLRKVAAYITLRRWAWEVQQQAPHP